MSVKIITANKSNKQALLDWEDFKAQIFNATTINHSETLEQKTKRIKELEANPEQWFKYYFPKYCFCESANFHKQSTKKVLNATRYKQGRRWFRGSSKSTRRMFEIFYKMLVQKFRTNCLLISKSEGNAIRLLAPYMANLDSNQRIINDYGIQEKPGSWAMDEFITRSGHTFRAVGAEQNPRGARLEDLRVTVIIADDMDDDEVCQNPDRVEKRWQWFERAVIPTVDISGNYLIFFDNNLIAEDSCAARFANTGADIETVNIRDDDGNSSWPEKNSEKDIDDILDTISYEAGQAEYFNNPINAGKVFKEITYGKCPPLKQLPFAVIYADPATSNADKPTAKSKSKNSTKAVVVVGYKDLKYYVYKAYLENTKNSTFIDWMYAAFDYVKPHTVAYNLIENNTLQNPFYEQVLLPLIFQQGQQRNEVLPVIPDTRQKPDKYFRIEGTLEPLNRLGQLIFNIDEKDNPHMKRLEAQFKAVSVRSKVMDGPDAVEGAVDYIKRKVAVYATGAIKTFKRTPNPKRY